MKALILWKGYDRKWAVVNNHWQIVRDGFEKSRLAEEWAIENGYSI